MPKQISRNVPLNYCINIHVFSILNIAHLDRDKICLAFISYGFSQQGLSASRGAIEQHSLRGGHPKLKELLRVLNRILYKDKE
jgi:hypothetical protein